MVDIGFTGTQQGMTAMQKSIVLELLRSYYAPGSTVHHGDCIGADEEFHGLARACGYRVCLHPPDNDSKRSFRPADIVCDPLPYLERNSAIVEHGVTALIATPKEKDEQLRSGTWATVRRGHKANRRVHLVFP